MPRVHFRFWGIQELRSGGRFLHGLGSFGDQLENCSLGNSPVSVSAHRTGVRRSLPPAPSQLRSVECPLSTPPATFLVCLCIWILRDCPRLVFRQHFAFLGVCWQRSGRKRESTFGTLAPDAAVLPCVAAARPQVHSVPWESQGTAAQTPPVMHREMNWQSAGGYMSVGFPPTRFW